MWSEGTTQPSYPSTGAFDLHVATQAKPNLERALG